MLSKLPLSAIALPRCAVALALGLGLAQAAAAISGVCPDGSMFIVQDEAQIPCKRAKTMEPAEIPPIKPEYLPTPYTWKVYNEANDPNNPYNLIDAAREVRALRDAAAAEAQGQRIRLEAARRPSPARPGRSLPRTWVSRTQKLRDLYLLVELSQDRAPAMFSRETADGRGVFEMRLARSHAFETRLQQAWASRGGLQGSGVLIFTALSKRPEDFHANLTFVQDHLTFQPDAGNARQLGILQGRLGDLDADELVLGYVVLPESLDLDRAIDVYWNDRLIEARFGS